MAQHEAEMPEHELSAEAPETDEGQAGEGEDDGDVAVQDVVDHLAQGVHEVVEAMAQHDQIIEPDQVEV